MLGRSKKTDARARLRELEKRLDLKGLEKRLEQFEGKDLDKVLERLDWKDLEKKLEKDVARRYRDLRRLGYKEEPKASSAGFFAGLVIGAVVGAVLAILFSKQNEQSPMDRFIMDPGSEQSPHSSGSETTGGGIGVATSMSSAFGDDVAIEREINGEGESVTAATDAVDSASEDVRSATERVQDDPNRPAGNL